MSPGTFPLSTPRGWDCKHATVSCFLHVLGSNSDSCFCMRWFPDAADCWGKTYKHMKQPLLISRYSLKSHGEAGNSAERTSGLEEEMVLLALWLSEDTVTLRGHCDQRAEGWGVEVEGMLQAGPRLCSLPPLSSSLAQVPSPGSHLTPGRHPSQYAPVVENTPVREGPTLYKVECEDCSRASVSPSRLFKAQLGHESANCVPQATSRSWPVFVQPWSQKCVFQITLVIINH